MANAFHRLGAWTPKVRSPTPLLFSGWCSVTIPEICRRPSLCLESSSCLRQLGARSCRHLNTVSKTLQVIHQTGSQCSWCSSDVLCFLEGRWRTIVAALLRILLKSTDLCNCDVYKERITVVKALCDQCLDCWSRCFDIKVVADGW